MDFTEFEEVTMKLQNVFLCFDFKILYNFEHPDQSIYPVFLRGPMTLSDQQIHAFVHTFSDL